MQLDHRRITVLFDTPPHLNDKPWLARELTRIGFDVREVVLHTKTTITRMSMQGAFSKAACILVSGAQAIRAVAKSRKGEYILCWNPLAGHLVNELVYRLNLERQVICMNWLTPESSDMQSPFVRHCLANERTRIFVNLRESAASYRELFEATGESVRASFHWFPDVFDDQVPFKSPEFTRNERGRLQCFTGGMNNRDWAMVVETARLLPEVDFVCVALREDWDSKVAGDVPTNVYRYDNLPLDEYQRLMGQSAVVFLPLLEHRVSGLINIIRCAQDGHLCCVTNYDFTAQYFADGRSPFLLENDARSWADALDRIAHMSDEEYVEAASDFQSFIRETYSPHSAGDRLKAILLDGQASL